MTHWKPVSLENWCNVFDFLCLCQDPGSSRTVNQLQQDWRLNYIKAPYKITKRIAFELLLCAVWLCAYCCTDTNNVSKVQHGDAAECVAMCAPRESPPPHATLLMARFIWWRLPPTHQRPCSPSSLPTREGHLVDSGCNYSPTSLLTSPWPALLYTQNNLWFGAQALSSYCTSTVGQEAGKTGVGGGGKGKHRVVFPPWWWI